MRSTGDTPHAEEGFHYGAFISYRHTDKAWGAWLHEELESYRVPRELVGQTGAHGRVPARLGRVFRDREELSAGDLSDEIDQAIRTSEHLVVICSPAATGSRWVNDEILAWKRLHGEERLYAIIVAGEPNAADPAQECFPSALRYELGPDGTLTDRRADPIAADAREEGDGKENAKLKLIAGMLGVPYDSLRRRDQEARARAFRRFAAIAVTLVLTFAGLAAGAGWFAWQSERQRIRAEANLDAAIDAAVNIIFELAEKSKNTVGVQRRVILAIQAQAQALLDKLGQGQSLTPGGRRARAVSMALSSQAMVASGDSAGGLKLAEDALAQMQAVADADPGNARFQRDLASCLERVGDCRSSARDAGGALASYRAALAIYERLAAPNPSDGGLQRKIAGLWQAIGAGLERDDGPGARDALQRSIAVLARLPRDDPEAQANESLRANAIGTLGDLQANGGEPEAAEASYRASLEIRRRVSAADRGNAWRLSQLSGSIQQLADFLGGRGAFAEALAGLDEATQIDRRLYALDPEDMIAGGSLFTSLWEEGDLREGAGDEIGARTAFTEGIALGEELIIKGRQDAAFKLLLASTLMKLGKLDGHTGRADEARESFRRASEIAGTVLPPDPLAPMAAQITKVLNPQSIASP